MIRFLGVYDYTVILTYLSLFSSIFGITQAIHGDYKTAILCAIRGYSTKCVRVYYNPTLLYEGTLLAIDVEGNLRLVAEKLYRV